MEAGANNSPYIGDETKYGYHADFRQVHHENDLSLRIKTIIEDLGFTHYSFIKLDSINVEKNVFDTFPMNLCQLHNNGYYHIDDLIIQNANRNKNAFYLSTILNFLVNATFNCDVFDNFKNSYKICKSNGFYDVYHLPIQAEYLLSVTARGVNSSKFRQISSPLRQTLTLLGEAIHYAVTYLFPYFEQSQKYADLNKKPLQVLEELANSDLTIGQIADKLCISRITANHHLKTVRNKFNVKTNNAAIKKAIQGKFIRYTTA